MIPVFLTGGASYNAIITLDNFPGMEPKTIHQCNYHETIGNTGAGKALTLSRLGFDITFQTLIGTDVYGDEVISRLQHPNINLKLDVDALGTERHLNIMNAKGERISIFTNPSSDEPKIDYGKYEMHIKSSEYVIINISNYCRNFISSCQRLGKQIWTDLHDYDGVNAYHQDFIDASDYIFMSSDNFKAYKPFMYDLINNGKALVVCTHGRAGASALSASGEWIDIPIIRSYDTINTNGAGDAFFSGFLYGFHQNYSLKKCMEIATITAGLTIESKELFCRDLSVNRLKEEYQKHYV